MMATSPARVCEGGGDGDIGGDGVSDGDGDGVRERVR